MIVKDRCIRAYYCNHGNFDGIENTKFYDYILKRSKQENKKVQDYLYSVLGYKPTLELSESQRHEIREDFDKGNYEYLFRIFEVNNKDSLVYTLNSLDCLGVPAQKPEEIPNYEYVKILANYFETNKNVILDVGNDFVRFSDIITKISTLNSKRFINKELKDDDFKAAVNIAAPKIEYREGCTPTIMLNKFYIPEELSVKERNAIVNNAVKCATLKIDRISLDDRLRVMGLVKGNVIKLPETGTDRFLLLNDLAVSLNITIKELLEICSLNYIDILKQIEDMYCTVEYAEGGGVMIYSYRSETVKDCIMCNVEDFQYLYEHDILKTLTFEQGKAYITTSNRFPVSTLFVGVVKKDFRR